MMTKQGKRVSNGRNLSIFTAILFVSIVLFPTIGLSEGSGRPGATNGSQAAQTDSTVRTALCNDREHCSNTVPESTLHPIPGGA
jgi:hypothetical protein